MRVKALINLDNLKYNLDLIKSKIPNDKIMAVVKANAYGHGDEEIFKYCIKEGINFFGVATSQEARKLISINKNVNILILSPVEQNEILELSNLGIHLTISSFEDIDYILNNSISGNFHLAFDTGMGRIGFNENNIEKAIKLLKPIGVFSHLSVADIDEDYTNKQKNIFELIMKYDIKYKHLLNSFGTEYFDFSEKYDLYRIGILMYGAELNYKYKPLLTFLARVSYVKKLEKDSYIGYGNTYFAKKDTYIATISAGYADGIMRSLSNKGEVYLNGKNYPIIGNVCMDQFMILADEKISVGDYVEIFGENINVNEVAIRANTISYEILCYISSRVPRIYFKEENK